MVPASPSEGRTPSRRKLLAAIAGTSISTGCVDRLSAVDSRTNVPQVSFKIKTLPTDEDPFAMRLARQLAEWFQEAGIDATVLPVTGDELLRQVLLRHDYDAFVAQFPGQMTDPDELYGLVHSSYAAEPGWQNPFGYSSLSTDDALERQRTADGTERRDGATALQEELVDKNPFTVLAMPERITASRDDRFDGLDSVDLRDPRAYFSIDSGHSDAETLHLVTTDSRAMGNLNPLSPEYRQDELLTRLIYEPLVDLNADESLPRLARDVVWRDSDPPTAQIELRESLHWHDSREISASDVAFTYEFLQDTALGDLDEAVPATRYRGRSSLVSSVTVRDDATAIVHFTDCEPVVARRALTVPILPKHVWQERTETATRRGTGTTEALVTNNVPAVGSGPLKFERATNQQNLVLTRFEGHPSRQAKADDPSHMDANGLVFEELVIEFVASDDAAVEPVVSDDVDATIANLSPRVVPRIGREDALDLSVTQSNSFYYAGYNTLRPPFSNTRFRALLSQLIDRATLVDEVLDGYGHPAISPLAATDWVPDTLTWGNDTSVATFLGRNGTIDVEAARDAFAEAGYRYDEQGRLRGA